MQIAEVANEHWVEAKPLEEIAEVALQSMVGLGCPKTLKLKGLIGSTEVLVLIDSGSTHNFIALKLVKELYLPLNETNGYEIILGTGVSVRCTEICKDVVLSLGTITIIQDFLPINLATIGVILGVQWLATLVTLRPIINLFS